MTDLFDMAVAAKLAGGSGGGEAVLKTKTVTANGVYNASSDHADGYSSVTVAVPTPAPPVLTTKSITENGTYTAAGDNADGYSSVTVAVPLVADGNLFDFTKKRVENGYRNHTLFEVVDDQLCEIYLPDYAPTCYISEYIPVEAGVKYFLVLPKFTWDGVNTAIYDANKELISSLEAHRKSYQEITIPSGGAFVRFSVVDTTGISLTTCPEYERLVSFCRA